MKYLTVKEIRENRDYIRKHKVRVWKSWIARDGTVLKYISDLSRDIKILDLGCGDGGFVKWLYDTGFRELGLVDLDDYVIYPEIRNRLKIVDLSMEKLPYQDQSFDLLTAFQVFEHLENPFHFIRECHRVLKKNGLLIMSMPYADRIPSRFHYLLAGNHRRWNLHNEHITFLTKDVFTKTVLKYFGIQKILYDKGLFNFYLFGFRLKNLPRSKCLSTKICYFLKKL